MIVGLDYDWLSLSKHKTIKTLIRGDIGKLPFSDNSFDLVTANMVFEHLENPQEQLNEISRILQTGGRLIFHTPNKLSYATLMARLIPEIIKDKLKYFLQNRKEEDVFPAHYRINSPSAIKKLASESGFKVLKIKLICTSAQFIMIPPLVFFELIWIRFLMSTRGKPLRTNIIAILEKA
jgi:ubiquinone/menaquinone biosynthesis C-methylase UbiE